MNTSDDPTRFSFSTADARESTGTKVLLSSGNTWRGIRLEEHERGPGEEGECAFANDMLILNLASSDVIDIRLAGHPNRGRLAPNSLNVLPANTSIHSSRWRQHIHFVAMAISSEFVNAMYPGRSKPIELLQHIGVVDPYMSAALLALRQDVRTGCSAGSFYGESVSAALLVHVAANYGAESERGAEWHRLTEGAITKILDCIEADLSDPPSVVALAGLVEMEVPRFVRAFKARVGVSPVQYIVQRRIEHAKILLGNRALSICDIALQLGFANQSHFATVFRRLTNTSPSAFRVQRRRD